MNFLQRKHDTGERRIERRGKSGRRAAGNEKMLLQPKPLESARDALACHAAELYRRAFSAQRQTAQNTHKACRNLAQNHTPPARANIAHQFRFADIIRAVEQIAVQRCDQTGKYADQQSLDN